MTVGLYAMQKIFLRFHHIPYEDLAKMVLANKKKSGFLHFEEFEKMAQEIAEELLMDLMKFTMEDKNGYVMKNFSLFLGDYVRK